MNTKITALTIALLGFSSILFAQDSKFQRLAPFDSAKFNERFEEFDILSMDSLKIIDGAVFLKDENKNKYAMRWFKLNEDDMAPMPKMGISKDLHYNMNIKKYESYPKFDDSLKLELLEENKDLNKPMKKKKE